MNRKRSIATRAASILVAIVIIATLVACGTSSPGPSSSPAASPATSKPSTSTAPSSSPAASSASSASASAKPAASGDQTYQKAMSNWPKIVEAAQKEGQVNISAIFDPDTAKKLEDAFNKLDPKIQLKMSRLTGAQATERFKAEQATKQYASNGYMGGSPSARPMAEQDLIQPLEDLPNLYEPGAKWVQPPLMDLPKQTFTLAYTNYFIIYNTALIPAGQEPKSWKDLAEPRFKDKVALWEPRVGGIGQAVLGTLYEAPGYGPDLVRKIVENTRVMPDATTGPQQVAKGEMLVSVTTWGTYLTVKDAPVKVIVPEDGAIATPTQAVLVKNAPQANGVKVFFNWLISKDGQKLLSEPYAIIRADVDPITKQGQLAGAKLMPNSPPPYDWEMKTIAGSAKVFGKWLDELGK